jgi:hypothetical protein
MLETFGLPMAHLFVYLSLYSNVSSICIPIMNATQITISKYLSFLLPLIYVTVMVRMFMEFIA